LPLAAGSSRGLSPFPETRRRVWELDPSRPTKKPAARASSSRTLAEPRFGTHDRPPFGHSVPLAVGRLLWFALLDDSIRRDRDLENTFRGGPGRVGLAPWVEGEDLRSFPMDAHDRRHRRSEPCAGPEFLAAAPLLAPDGTVHASIDFILCRCVKEALSLVQGGDELTPRPAGRGEVLGCCPVLVAINRNGKILDATKRKSRGRRVRQRHPMICWGPRAAAAAAAPRTSRGGAGWFVSLRWGALSFGVKNEKSNNGRTN
jgi:hypothetical protein